jgi:hypothetical protein
MATTLIAIAPMVLPSKTPVASPIQNMMVSSVYQHPRQIDGGGGIGGKSV